jgi:hypothetical protein
MAARPRYLHPLHETDEAVGKNCAYASVRWVALTPHIIASGSGHFTVHRKIRYKPLKFVHPDVRSFRQQPIQIESSKHHGTRQLWQQVGLNSNIRLAARVRFG